LLDTLPCEPTDEYQADGDHDVTEEMEFGKLLNFAHKHQGHVDEHADWQEPVFGDQNSVWAQHLVGVVSVGDALDN